jgi:uncharacterized membrane protein
MRTKLSRWIDLLRTGFWFLPSLMLFLSAGFALLLLYIDQRLDPGMKASLPWAYSGGPEGARSLLSTIAGSMITAASVTFSLASVALSIASQQYGSRVLRNFMRDRITQVLLRWLCPSRIRHRRDHSLAHQLDPFDLLRAPRLHLDSGIAHHLSHLG